MSDFYDSLETRNPGEREQAIQQALRAQIAQAKSNTTAYAEILREVDADNVETAIDFSKLPITRKSELIELQGHSRPFGGYTATNVEHTHVFASPGPIYEPGYATPDFWRLARALYASGFRRGDLVHNSFSYHLTPAGMMLESGAHALGCAVIPAGVGQTELQLQTIVDLGPQAYVGTDSAIAVFAFNNVMPRRTWG